MKIVRKWKLWSPYIREEHTKVHHWTEKKVHAFSLTHWILGLYNYSVNFSIFKQWSKNPGPKFLLIFLVFVLSYKVHQIHRCNLKTQHYKILCPHSTKLLIIFTFTFRHFTFFFCCIGVFLMFTRHAHKCLKFLNFW